MDIFKLSAIHKFTQFIFSNTANLAHLLNGFKAWEARGRSGLRFPFLPLENPPFVKWLKSTLRKWAFHRTAAGQQLHGSFTPSHACGCAAQCCEGVQRGSIIVLPVRPSPASCHACFAARCCSLCFSPTEKSGHGALRRPAQYKENVSDLPYAAPPLSCAAFFFKVQQQGRGWEQRKGGRCFSIQALNDRTARMSFDRKRSRMSSSMP